jgi:hypothetical protein
VLGSLAKTVNAPSGVVDDVVAGAAGIGFDEETVSGMTYTRTHEPTDAAPPRD